MKKISLFLFGMLLFGSVAHAGIGVLEDSAYLGETGAINCSTDLDCSQSGNITTIALEANISRSIIAATYYVTVPYYSKLTMIGSGAPVGSVIQRGGDGKNCGDGGDGTTVYLCQSTGSNWILV
jgi:hypothetical protein